MKTIKLLDLIKEEASGLEDFKKALEKHDWYHMMSDSSKKWEAGVENQKKLIAKAKEIGPAAIKLLNSKHKEFFPKASPLVK
jgi:hypothetical protein